MASTFRGNVVQRLLKLLKLVFDELLFLSQKFRVDVLGRADQHLLCLSYLVLEFTHLYYDFESYYHLLKDHSSDLTGVFEKGVLDDLLPVYSSQDLFTKRYYRVSLGVGSNCLSDILDGEHHFQPEIQNLNY